MGLEARDFFRKKIFGNKKYKILRDLSCASRRLGLGGGGSPPTLPLKRQNNRK